MPMIDEIEQLVEEARHDRDFVNALHRLYDHLHMTFHATSKQMRKDNYRMAALWLRMAMELLDARK
jgi:hypothetical protein